MQLNGKYRQIIICRVIPVFSHFTTDHTCWYFCSDYLTWKSHLFYHFFGPSRPTLPLKSPRKRYDIGGGIHLAQNICVDFVCNIFSEALSSPSRIQGYAEKEFKHTADFFTHLNNRFTKENNRYLENFKILNGEIYHRILSISHQCTAIIKLKIKYITLHRCFGRHIFLQSQLASHRTLSHVWQLLTATQQTRKHVLSLRVQSVIFVRPWTKIWIRRQIFVEVQTVRSCENPPGGSHSDTREQGQTDRLDDANSRFKNTPKTAKPHKIKIPNNFCT